MSADERTMLRRIWDRYDETKLIKAVFFGMLSGVVATLYIDYQELQRTAAYEVPSGARPVPVLPAAIPQTGEPSEQLQRPDFVTTPAEAHRDAMKIELTSDGVLALTGTIDVGTATFFTEELAKIGEYIKVVQLDSPGGSLEDALVMGEAIREGGYDTRIVGGNLCASACPLVFAGGVNRTIDEKAAFGVHQIYTSGDTVSSPAQALYTAQETTARVSRYLEKMGVDPSVWTYALETPPAQLYYLSGEQLAEYDFVTG